MALVTLVLMTSVCYAHKQGVTAGNEKQTEVNVTVQGTYEEIKMLRAERILKKGDRYYAVTFDVDWLVGPEGLQPVLAREAFGVEADAPNRALSAFISRYDSVFTKQQKPMAVADSIVIMLKNVEYTAGRYISYSLLTWQKTAGEVQSKERNFTYDLMHGKLLTLEDIFTPEYMKKNGLHDISGEISISVGQKRVIYWIEGGDKGDKPTVKSYDEVELSEDFRELVGLSDLRQFYQRLDIKKISAILQNYNTTHGYDTFSTNIERNLMKSMNKSLGEKEREKQEGFMEFFKRIESLRKKGGTLLPKSKEKNMDYDVQPEYPGGAAGVADFLSKNIAYPIDAEEAGMSGEMTFYILIDAEGTVKDAFVGEVNKDIYDTITTESGNDGVYTIGLYSLEKEVATKAKTMGAWTPAKDAKGKNIPALYPVNITFVSVR